MRNSKTFQKDHANADGASPVARPLAPEDIQLGDYVSVLHAVCELPSFLWHADVTTLPAHEPVRIRFVPRDDPRPFKVKAICLPFVMTKLPCGETVSLDIRRHRLARLDRRYALRAWKAAKKRR